MRNHAFFYAFAKAAPSKVQDKHIATVNKDVAGGKGWNANLSYRTAQKLKAEGIID